jgi:hypothetical protein
MIYFFIAREFFYINFCTFNKIYKTTLNIKLYSGLNKYLLYKIIKYIFLNYLKLHKFYFSIEIVLLVYFPLIFPF